MEIINNQIFWKWYFLITGIITCFIGLLWLYRFRKIECSENWQSFFWNSIIQYFGFFLVYLQAQILILILNKIDVTDYKKITVLGILFIFMMIYSIFCISGRGIQIFTNVLEKGVRKISILGITIETKE